MYFAQAFGCAPMPSVVCDFNCGTNPEIIFDSDIFGILSCYWCELVHVCPSAPCICRWVRVCVKINLSSSWNTVATRSENDCRQLMSILWLRSFSTELSFWKETRVCTVISPFFVLVSFQVFDLPIHQKRQ